MQHELARRAFEDPLEDVAGQLAFGLLCGQACCIDVRTLRFVSLNQTFCGHDLKEFQDAGVTDIFGLGQRFMDVAYRGWPTRPQYAQDFEFGGSRLLRGRLFHDKAQYYEGVRSVNENGRRMNLAFRDSQRIHIPNRIFLSGSSLVCDSLPPPAVRFDAPPLRWLTGDGIGGGPFFFYFQKGVLRRACSHVTAFWLSCISVSELCPKTTTEGGQP